MSPERWREIEALFDRVAGRSAADCAETLARADPGLRAEVEKLLASDGQGKTLIANAVAEGEALIENEVGNHVEDQRLQRFGPYRVTGTLGYGGMGAVYRAVRDDGAFDKVVAIKVLHLGMETPSAMDSFRRERKILAGLEHPHIARLLDGGEAGGLPYIVLEYVEGEPITEYFAGRDISQEDRLRLFLRVCEAVEYAHRNLVVHRDLKPANILVTADGTPKLLDFGIARLLDADAGRTATIFQAMTPAYASPEQVRGKAITTASDVYSLGVVLYHLLTGQRPYEIPSLTPSEIDRVVCQSAPAPPHISEDLDNILLMALRKEPERRYPSVREFAADIERSLTCRPVIARKDTLVYRARRFARRNRLALATSVAVFLALAAGLGVALYEARLANARFQDVRSLANTFLFDFDKEISAVPGNTRARELLAATARKYLDNLAGTAGNDESLLLELAIAYEKLGDVQGMPGLSNLGLTPEAAESYRKAIVILERLARKNPKYRSRLAIDLGRSGRIAGELNLTESALDLATRAAALSSRLLAESPGDPELGRNTARSFDLLSSIQQGSYRSEEAIESSRKAIESYTRSIPPNAPPKSSHPIALALNRLALASRNLSDLDSAGIAARRALDIETGILRLNPRDASSRIFEGGLLETLAELEDSDRYPSYGRPAEAAKHWGDALRIDCGLADADRNDIRAHVYCAIAGAGLALVHLRRNAAGDVALADHYSEIAADTLDAVLRQAPRAGFARGHLPIVASVRALALSSRGRCAEAIGLSRRGLDAERIFVRESNSTNDNRLDLAGQLLRHAQVLSGCGQRDATREASREAAVLFAGLDSEMHRWMSYAYQAGAYRFGLARELENAARESADQSVLPEAAASYAEAARFWSIWQPGRQYIAARVSEAIAARDRCLSQAPGGSSK